MTDVSVSFEHGHRETLLGQYIRQQRAHKASAHYHNIIVSRHIVVSTQRGVYLLFPRMYSNTTQTIQLLCTKINISTRIHHAEFAASNSKNINSAMSSSLIEEALKSGAPFFSAQFAAHMDAKDPLASFRSEFMFPDAPAGSGRDKVVYLCGMRRLFNFHAFRSVHRIHYLKHHQETLWACSPRNWAVRLTRS